MNRKQGILGVLVAAMVCIAVVAIGVGDQVAPVVNSDPAPAVVVAGDPLVTNSVVVANDDLNNAAANRVIISHDADTKKQAGPGENNAVDRVVERRITNLPEDGGKFHVTVWTHADWQRRPYDCFVMNAFNSHPDLRFLKTQTHFRQLHPGMRLYSEWQHSVTTLPAVTVQDPAGHTVYKASAGDKLPSDANTLAQHIRFMIGEYNPNLFVNDCPYRPAPSPVQPVAPVRPTGVPDKAPTIGGGASNNGGFLVAGLGGVVAFIFGGAYAWRKDSSRP